MLYGAVLGIHLYAMCTALLLFVAAEFLLLAARRGYRRPARMAFLASRLAGPLTGAGVLAGIVLVVLGGWSLLTPWLVASIALIGALMAVEHTFVRPWAMRGQMGHRGSAVDVKALAADSRAMAGRLAVIALFALIIALMVAKPELNGFA
ncbi:hypothetical protein [Mesorhizobium sp. B2-3-15]|uniref:hypothetical protein n=1 Tax=Mesorhizobium sp. B2-3-15 TaxID=2589949 RepID=UPI0011277C04|nr:hypothetical protein [Mesorhizobium sp. B2-3-15]TPL71621.1 hypothetical protein FJ954_18795 [Mesorhizobium sp. B2-3-15]